MNRAGRTLRVLLAMHPGWPHASRLPSVAAPLPAIHGGSLCGSGEPMVVLAGRTLRVLLAMHPGWSHAPRAARHASRVLFF